MAIKPKPKMSVGIGVKIKRIVLTPEQIEIERALSEEARKRPIIEPPELSDREEADRILGTFDEYEY